MSEEDIIIDKTTAIGPSETAKSPEGMSNIPIPDSIKAKTQEELYSLIKEEKPCPEVHIKWHGREVEIDVICHEGLPLGYIELAAHRIVMEIQKVRAAERVEARMDEYQKGLDTPVKTEGQEMAEAFEEAQQEAKLPEPNLDTPSTSV